MRNASARFAALALAPLICVACAAPAPAPGSATGEMQESKEVCGAVDVEFTERDVEEAYPIFAVYDAEGCRFEAGKEAGLSKHKTKRLQDLISRADRFDKIATICITGPATGKCGGLQVFTKVDKISRGKLIAAE